MKKFKVELTETLNITFDDESKAEQLYLESDWKECFFDFDSLEEVVEHISAVFHNTDYQFEKELANHGKYIEGFGTFWYQPENKWKNDDDVGGYITIEVIDDLYPSYVDET